MSSSNTGYQIKLAPFAYLTLLFIASGNILFFIGWYIPIVAILASLATLGGVAYMMKRITPSLEEYTLYLSNWDIVRFMLASLLILAFLIASGFVGYFPTHGDHSILRQALYHNLTDAPWPLVLPDGKAFTYYIANFLPLNVLARLFDESARQYILLAYVFGMFLMCYVLVCFYLKKVSLLALLLLICLPDPIREIVARVHAYFIIDNFPALTELGNDFIRHFSYMELNAFGSSVGAYNSTPVTLMALALIILIKKARHITIPLIIALIFPSSPLNALAIMPVALFYYIPVLKNKKMLYKAALSLILPIIIVAITTVYFARAENSTTVVCFLWQVMDTDYFLEFLVRQLGACLIFTLPLLVCKSIGKEKYLLLFPLAASFVYYGFPAKPGDLYILNEFYFKAVHSYHLLAIMLWVKYWREFKYSKYLILVSALMSLVLLIKTKSSSFTTDPTVKDVWNGHLYHDDPFFSRLPGAKENSLFSEILLKESGESERTIPGSLLPKAKGCDYTRPSNISK